MQSSDEQTNHNLFKFLNFLFHPHSMSVLSHFDPETGVFNKVYKYNSSKVYKNDHNKNNGGYLPGHSSLWHGLHSPVQRHDV